MWIDRSTDRKIEGQKERQGERERDRKRETSGIITKTQILTDSAASLTLYVTRSSLTSSEILST